MEYPQITPGPLRDLLQWWCTTEATWGELEEGARRYNIPMEKVRDGIREVVRG
jgi:hypothetical protein